MERELANTLELTDGGKSLMLLVCLNEEIKDREREREKKRGIQGLTRCRGSGVVGVRLPSSFTVMKAPSLPPSNTPSARRFAVVSEMQRLNADKPPIFVIFLPAHPGTTGHAVVARGAPRTMMSCLKSNQKLTSPWLFVSASVLESSQMLWKAGSRLFIQQRISPKHTHSISRRGYLSREAQVTVFLKSGRHKSPSAANYNSHPTC